MPNLSRFVHSLLLTAALFSTAALAQSPAKEFFKPAVSVAGKASAVGRAPGVVSDAFPIAFNRAEMLALVPGEEVQLTLPNATSHTVVFELAQDHGGGIHSWVGYFKDRGNDNRVILTTGPAGSFGVINAPEGSYRVVPGKNHDWLVDMTQEQLHLPIAKFANDAIMPPPRAKGLALSSGVPTWTAAIPGVNRVGIDKATPSPLATIDLMFVATTGLANRLGAGLLTRLNFIVTAANTAYADSEVGINLRLVNVTLVNYPDATDNGAALDAINPNSPSFDAATFGSIETIREQVKADMVALMRNGDDFGGAGLAFIGNAPPDPLGMYSVTTGCVQGCEGVFIHELGHNMGNMHDRATVAFGAGGTTTYGQGAYPYSFGYAFCKSGAMTCNPNLPNGTAGACAVGVGPECADPSDLSNFAEIMAYFGNSTVRIQKFSNPAITCKSPTGDGVDRPCGVSESATGVTLTTGSANTALSMNTNRAAISALKTGAANPPGIIQFANTAFSGAESGGTIAFTVSRINGSGGAVSISYTMAGGTATAGTDFTATGGTVSWADNDAANKTITVPVTSDALVEGIETFTVSLAGPTGGATLGNLTTASGMILEPWPAGGVAPVGFSSAVTPTLAWAVATDSFDPNGVDTVSYKSAAFTYEGTGNSSTQYAGSFDAGTVSFAYRVSSYPGLESFQFLIDDVVVVTDAGDSGWKFFSTPITAGNHTLEWRYYKKDPFYCKNVLPPPPQGDACEDRAWIDTVSLPLQGTVQKYALTVTPAGAGSGTVTSSPAGITCGATCSANFNSGTSVTLTASATAGSVFASWSGGGCSGTSTCTVTVSTATTVTATFNVAPPSTFALTVSKAGSGGGTVTSSPAGISCGTTCSANFNSGASVTLMATAAAGSSFSGWSGACTGTGTCSLTMSVARAVTATFALATSIPRLANISTRGRIEINNDVMIGGFIISGSAPKKVLITARGPSLTAFGVVGAIANPTMQLFSGQTVIASNDDWQTNTNVAEILATGIAPSSPLESAIMMTLNPGAYTAVVSGVGGGMGVGIVEVFEQDHPEVPLINISTRGQVKTGDNVMIGGFIIQGDAPKTVLITARGPSLIPFGITNALANPTLQLYSGQTVVASNDDWQTNTNADAILATGVAPGNALESAILITLNPGAYTAIVSGVGGGTGVGIVEVFAQ